MDNGWMIMAAALCVLVTGDAVAAPSDAGGQPAFTDLMSPVGMVYGRDGALYVAEWSAGRVSRFDAQGNRTILVDALGNPAGLALADDGTLYIAGYGDGTIYMFDEQHGLRPFVSGFSAPTGLLWSRDGTLLVANRNAGEIVRVLPDGRKRVVSRDHALPVGLAQTSDGGFFVSCYGGSVDHIAPNGDTRSVYTGLRTPGAGIIPDGPDAVLVTEYGGNAVVRIDVRGRASIAADGVRSPAGLARMPDGRFLVGCWGDATAYCFESSR